MKLRASGLWYSGLAAIVALVAIISLRGCADRAHSVVRVVYPPNGRALPVLIAQEQGFFAEQGVTVYLTPCRQNPAAAGSVWDTILGQLSANEIDVAVGCPFPVIAAAVQKSPSDWSWFNAGAETSGGNVLSALYVKRRAGLKGLDAVEQRIASHPAKLAVQDAVWKQEAERLWRFPDGSPPTIVSPLTPDRFEELPVEIVFGDALELSPFNEDPRFTQLDSNVRAHRWGDPYLDSASFTRRSFVEAHAEALVAISVALEQAQKHLAENPEQARRALRRLGIDVSGGKNFGLPAYMSTATVDAALAGWGRGDAESAGTLLTAARWLPKTSIVAGRSRKREVPAQEPDMPPFTAPKPKDVQVEEARR